MKYTIAEIILIPVKDWSNRLTDWLQNAGQKIDDLPPTWEKKMTHTLCEVKNNTAYFLKDQISVDPLQYVFWPAL